MAVSTTISNFFSFLSPPKPNSNSNSIPKPKTLLQFPLSPNRSHSQRLAPLFASTDDLPDFSPLIPSSLLASGNFMMNIKPCNVRIVRQEGESEDSLVNRFKRAVMRSGILQEAKRRRFHESNREKKKRKAREAAKRRSRARNNYRRPPRQGDKFPDKFNKDAPKTEKEDDSDDDNWELPEGELLNF